MVWSWLSMESLVADPAEKGWTVEEFLAWDDGTDRRYELLRGKITEIPPPCSG